MITKINSTKRKSSLGGDGWGRWVDDVLVVQVVAGMKGWGLCREIECASAREGSLGDKNSAGVGRSKFGLDPLLPIDSTPKSQP